LRAARDTSGEITSIITAHRMQKKVQTQTEESPNACRRKSKRRQKKVQTQAEESPNAGRRKSKRRQKKVQTQAEESPNAGRRKSKMRLLPAVRGEASIGGIQGQRGGEGREDGSHWGPEGKGDECYRSESRGDELPEPCLSVDGNASQKYCFSPMMGVKL
jgi:hypothetical protein